MHSHIFSMICSEKLLWPVWMRRVSQNKIKTITFVRSFPALLKGMFFSNTIDEALLNLISFFSVWKTIFLSMCNCWENCAPKEPVHISLLLCVIESVCIFVWNSCAFRHLMNPPHSLCANVLDGSHCRGVQVDECSTHLSLSLYMER